MMFFCEILVPRELLLVMRNQTYIRYLDKELGRFYLLRFLKTIVRY
jgi:hypothetical protein